MDPLLKSFVTMPDYLLKLLCIFFVRKVVSKVISVYLIFNLYVLHRADARNDTTPWQVVGDSCLFKEISVIKALSVLINTQNLQVLCI